MAAVVIIGVQPARVFVAALRVAGVEPRIGPLVGQSAMEALHLAVGLRPVGPSATMLDIAEGIAEDVRSITVPVVGQHLSNGDAAIGEPRVGTPPEAGGGVLALVGE